MFKVLKHCLQVLKHSKQTEKKKISDKVLTFILVFHVFFSLILFDSPVIRYEKCQDKLNKSKMLSVPFFLHLQSIFTDEVENHLNKHIC